MQNYSNLNIAIREVQRTKEHLTHDFIKAVAEMYADEIMEVVNETADVDYPAGREAGHNICLSADGTEGLTNILYTVMMMVKELP